MIRIVREVLVLICLCFVATGGIGDQVLLAHAQERGPQTRFVVKPVNENSAIIDTLTSETVLTSEAEAVDLREVLEGIRGEPLLIVRDYADDTVTFSVFSVLGAKPALLFSATGMDPFFQLSDVNGDGEQDFTFYIAQDALFPSFGDKLFPRTFVASKTGYVESVVCTNPFHTLAVQNLAQASQELKQRLGSKTQGQARLLAEEVKRLNSPCQ